MKNWNKKYNPIILLAISVLIISMDFFLRGGFTPLVILMLILAILLEIVFVRIDKVPPFVISLLLAALITILIKNYVINLKVINAALDEPVVPINSSVIYQPRMYSLKSGDIILYRENAALRVGVYNECDNTQCSITDVKDVISKKEKKDILGKVIKIISPKK